MRQITDQRAPFATIDEALTVGEEHIRTLGWSFVGMAAIEQEGGYFVRIAGTVHSGRAGRRGRKRFQHVTAVVGRIAQS